MSTEVRWRRGTAAQHANFAGGLSEITHDTTNNNLRIHDGLTPGGHATLMEGELGRPLGIAPLDGNGNVPESHLGYVLDIVESKKGAANGFASLDASGKIPLSQLGNVVGLDKYDYSSKASVEASPVPNTMTYLRIAGYYSAGDGGGAVYKKSASQPAHSGRIQSQDGAWWEIAESTLDFRMFGAKGDGVTNDAINIQACLDTALALGRYKVTLNGGGQYLYTTTVSIPDNVSIVGDKKTSLKKAASSNASILFGNGSSVYSIHVDGNRVGNPSNGEHVLLRVGDAHDVKIHDCILHGSNGYVVAINAGRRAIVTDNNIYDYYMFAVSISSNTNDPSAHVISGNRIDCNGWGAFIVGECYDALLSNNRITGRLIGGRDKNMSITKTGNKITRVSGDTGTEFDLLSPGQFVVADNGKEFRIVSIQDWNNLTVEDTTISLTNVRASAGTGDMIGVIASEFIRILDNVVDKCATFGMGLSIGGKSKNCNENTFSGNLIRFSGKNGINISLDSGSGGISDTLIIGNRMFNVGYGGGNADSDRDAIRFDSTRAGGVFGVLLNNNTCISYSGTGQTRALIGRGTNVASGDLTIGTNSALGTTNGIGS